MASYDMMSRAQNLYRTRTAQREFTVRYRQCPSGFSIHKFRDIFHGEDLFIPDRE